MPNSKDATKSDDVDRRWTFKREITSGDILLALAIVLPMVWYIAKLDNRVSLIEEKQSAQQMAQAKIDAAQDAVTRDALSRIDLSLRDIQQFLLQTRPKQ